MCFSAGASYGAGVLLVGVGAGAIKKIESPKMLAFASVPVLFGLHQLSEGVLWQSLANPGSGFFQNASIYFFLIFAKVIWPVWIPLSIWLMEPDKARKRILSLFMLIGGVSSAHLLYCIFAFEVSAFVEARHIRYDLVIPNLWFHRITYFLAAAIPFFLSSLRLMKLVGAALLASLVLSYIFFFHYVISVWCFFAAILSVLVFFVIVYNKENRTQNAN